MNSEVSGSVFLGLGMGICFFTVGVWMVKSGNPGLIHGYHLAQIPKGRLPFVARLVGFGIALVGAGVTLTGVIALATESPISASGVFVLPIILILLGLGIALTTIVVFTFRPWS